MTFDYRHASAIEIACAVRSRRVTAHLIATAALAHIEATNPAINAFTSVTADRALAEAAAIDAALSAGRDPGPLAGVPYAVKNLFDLSGVVTLAGSKINRSNPPALADCLAVSRLKDAGALCLGALNMGEYAYDFVTENTHYGPTKNPRDLTRSAGGSSGGSAAAVSANLVPFALSTDTNGSIRVPASFCGIWGLKPTYGRLPRTGSVPFVESLDHIGPHARSVADLSAVYDQLQGHSPTDAACHPRPVEPTQHLLDDGISGLRIATLGGYFQNNLSPLARRAILTVADALNTRAHAELPSVAEARAAAFVISASEGGQHHLARLKTRAADFDPIARDRFLAGALMPAAWYLHAQRFRAWYREQVRELFRHHDILLAAATPVPATTLGQETMTLDGQTFPVRPNLGLHTQPISFVGLPVVAAPLHLPGELPIAVQLIAAPWREDLALRVARQLEKLGVCSAPVASHA